MARLVAFDIETGRILRVFAAGASPTPRDRCVIVSDNTAEIIQAEPERYLILFPSDPALRRVVDTRTRSTLP